METLNRQFGLVIAYLLPGFIALAGVAPLSPVVAGWLHADSTASFGAPVYALLAATAAGMIVSCFRWFLVDQLLIMTGVPGPAFNARALEERPAAFNLLVENHYRYFQFYANTLIAVIWTYVIFRLLRAYSHLGIGTDIAALILCSVLFAGSRDALSKYRGRTRQLVGELIPKRSKGKPMTNGIDHNQGNGGNSEKPPVQPKPATKPAVPTKPTSASSADKQSK